MIDKITSRLEYTVRRVWDAILRVRMVAAQRSLVRNLLRYHESVYSTYGTPMGSIVQRSKDACIEILWQNTTVDGKPLPLSSKSTSNWESMWHDATIVMASHCDAAECLHTPVGYNGICYMLPVRYVEHLQDVRHMALDYLPCNDRMRILGNLNKELEAEEKELVW